jgi:hydroxyacylglutathione hydrolase
LLVDDASAFRQSAVRLIDFLKTRPVSHILGGHIELDASGDTYWFGTQYHPNEHALALSRNDLLALPAAFDHFNGFYARYPDYVLFSQNRILALEAAVVLVLLGLVVWGMIRLVKRWRRKRASARRAPASSDSQVTPAA